MAMDEAFKTFTAGPCFAVNPLYLIYPPYIPLLQRPSEYDVIFASVISYFCGSVEPSTPSFKAADQTHFSYTNVLFTLLITSQQTCSNICKCKWVKGSKEWQHKEVLFTSDRASFDCLIGLECVLALDSLSVSQDIITLSGFVCMCFIVEVCS